MFASRNQSVGLLQKKKKKSKRRSRSVHIDTTASVKIIRQIFYETVQCALPLHAVLCVVVRLFNRKGHAIIFCKSKIRSGKISDNQYSVWYDSSS